MRHRALVIIYTGDVTGQGMIWGLSITSETLHKFLRKKSETKNKQKTYQEITKMLYTKATQTIKLSKKCI